MLYLLFYLVGIAAAVLSPLSSIKEALVVLEPITLTALVASLLVPFAGFARTEKWQKFALQYAIVPLFGVYTVIMWHTHGIVGLLLLACVSLVHAGYWMSPIHSRQYRLEQFKLGFAGRMPAIAEFVAVLNSQGRSDQADAIVSEFLKGKIADGAQFIKVLCELNLENGDL